MSSFQFIDKRICSFHLRHTGFVYSVSKSFAKTNERIKKFQKTGDGRYLYRNKLDKTCSQSESGYGKN